jgi:serine/threonine protein kinase
VATVGTTIAGRFRVDQVLGAGGMGIVVSAMHLELGHRVAIKVLRDEMASDPTIVERFLREARAVVQLRTEHVCRVLDVGRLDTGAPYIVMELLDGSDLGRVVARQALPVTVAVEYVMQACVAIAEAHAAGIVHRDLKPANLFVTRRLDGGPLIKVLDFGIAKAMSGEGAQLTRSHSMMGSPGYISPEQLQSARDVDVRTDIWALGVTLYHLLSARLPFYRPNATEMAVRIVTEPPDPLDVPPALRAAVFRCLEKSPAQRYEDVAALTADLVPFGGPSARAIAGLVGQVIRRTVPAPLPAVPPVSVTAPTAASFAVGPTQRPPTNPPPLQHQRQRPPTDPPLQRQRPPTGAPLRSAPAATPVAAHSSPALGRRQPWWWIVAPVVVLTAAATSLLHWCNRSEPPPAPPPMVAAAPAVDAAVPDAPALIAPPVDASVPAPAWLPKPDTGAAATAPRLKPRPPSTPSAGSAVAPAPIAPQPRVIPPAAGVVASVDPNPPQRGKPSVSLKCKAMAKLEHGPALSVVKCLCQVNNPVRAKVVFARLSGAEREDARASCAQQGIPLP